jgi:hypothetical protein
MEFFSFYTLPIPLLVITDSTSAVLSRRVPDEKPVY